MHGYAPDLAMISGMFILQDFAKKFIRMNEVKAKRERDALETLEKGESQRITKVPKKTDYRKRKLPIRIQLRREAAQQSVKKSADIKQKLSIIVKGSIF